MHQLQYRCENVKKDFLSLLVILVDLDFCDFQIPVTEIMPEEIIARAGIVTEFIFAKIAVDRPMVGELTLSCWILEYSWFSHQEGRSDENNRHSR